MLTEQQGVPAKPFDPVEEIKRLRRGLALRLQTTEPPAEKIADSPISQTKIVRSVIEKKDAVSPPREMVPPETESVTLESVTKKADEMKKTLAIWQHSRLRTKPIRNDIFRGNPKRWGKRRKRLTVSQYLTTHQEGTLETVNAGLMALGIVGVVFGVLSFFRGMESDLSIGSLVCATGALIVVIGLGGRFFASHFDLSGT